MRKIELVRPLHNFRMRVSDRHTLKHINCKIHASENLLFQVVHVFSACLDIGIGGISYTSSWNSVTTRVVPDVSRSVVRAAGLPPVCATVSALLPWMFDVR